MPGATSSHRRLGLEVIVHVDSIVGHRDAAHRRLHWHINSAHLHDFHTGIASMHNITLPQAPFTVVLLMASRGSRL